jgi:hypothetical protein
MEWKEKGTYKVHKKRKGKGGKVKGTGRSFCAPFAYFDGFYAFFLYLFVFTFVEQPHKSRDLTKNRQSGVKAYTNIFSLLVSRSVGSFI